jgi:hypothetical protein
LYAFINQLNIVMLATDASRQKKRFTPDLGHPLTCFGRVFFLLKKIADQKIRPFTSESNGDGAADAAVRAGCSVPPCL